ncbi:diguanylate cyclase (GGDEF) domain-containing protein [Shewanella psychrophila]|uniref:Diguanylate cyclase (GGDEF) domain-containing protein n=1 Tax=Shewanella psychrophila TaxID=225848 RepID=A0A1S6HVT7_9GAMM|nr:GGDEF domain-containing protein [Shewanella psychrophila]AQS39690.1 diguanylate cyclase (GGDEF) domain-containing protein [Shewanella psychrophila]
MLTDFKITHKFPIVMISLALVSAIATGFIAFTIAKNEMAKSAENSLFALLESRKSSLNSYFSVIEKDLIFHAQSPLVIDAIKQFSLAWDALGDQQTVYLQDAYIHLNPYSNKQKDSLLQAESGALYNQYHSVYHPEFKNLVTTREFHDLFLFNTKGDLIYTVKKEVDFATNIFTGPWSETHLSQIVREIDPKPSIDQHVFADFFTYEPSDNQPASFIASPVFDSNKQFIGIIAFQMPIGPLNDVMHVTAGMGETGETYLVGPDLLMRSDSRFFHGRSILKTRVDTLSVRKALQGESGNDTILDYRHIPVFSAYAPVDFLGTRWAIIAEIDRKEILEPVYTMSHFLLLSGCILAIAIFFLGYLLASDISNPIVAMTRMMSRLARNDLSINISVSERKDEVGKMAEAMEVFKRNAIERDLLQRKLNHMAHHDTLTGLPTREFATEQFDALLQQSKLSGQKLVVMFADLDNFKWVNDTLGHQAGDRLLKETAIRLSDSIREGDIVARVGGDEFLIILPDAGDASSISLIAKKMIDSVAINFMMQEQHCAITLSIGVASYPEDGEEYSILINKADKAMYLAKKKGKNNFVFASEIDNKPLQSPSLKTNGG